jgi:DNA polymerase-3 subunit epsilon
MWRIKLLKNKKMIITFDLETTGVDVAKDRIVQIAYVLLDDSGKAVAQNCTLVNPQIPIPAEASAVHGITNEAVKDAPTFAQIAKAVAARFKGADVVTYNGNAFDVPLLINEFRRVGVPMPFDLSENGTSFYDGLVVERQLNRNTLSATYKRYTGEELEGAHDALADVKATLVVMQKQVALLSSLDEINPYNAVKLDSVVGRDFIFTIGKYKDKFVWWVQKNDPSYIDWFLRGNFSIVDKIAVAKDCNIDLNKFINETN